MKNYKLFLTAVAVLTLSIGACNKIADAKRSDRFIPEDTTPAEQAPVEEGGLWKIDTIAKEGAVWKMFRGVDTEVTKEKQIVNVMEIDLNKPCFHVKFHYGNRSAETSHGNPGQANAGGDGLTATDAVFSNKRNTEGAICCINAAYEAPSVFIRTDWGLNAAINNEYVGETNVKQWKSEGCVCSDGNQDVAFFFLAPRTSQSQPEVSAMRQVYKNLSYANIFTSSPVLIHDFDPVGTQFIYNMENAGYGKVENKDRLNYENPIRHQGVRHPRTVVALTEDNKFLMITIDGRWNAAKGMSAAEATRFIAHHFNPKYALNMDGGGSTCMCIIGRGDPTNNVVNYPAEDSTFDHLGIRGVNSHFYVTYDGPTDSGEGGTE